MLDKRVNVLEQSHQMLLEEVGRIQSDYRSWLVHQQEDWMEKSREMRFIHETVRANTTTLKKLEHQVSECQQRAAEEINPLAKSVNELQKTVGGREMLSVVDSERLLDFVEYLRTQQTLLLEDLQKQKQLVSAGMTRIQYIETEQDNINVALRSIQETREQEHMLALVGFWRLTASII